MYYIYSLEMCHCSSGSRMKGNKTEMYHWTLVKNCSLCLVFSFFEQYQSEYHCYSKYLALFCLEARDFQMSAVSDTRRPVHRWGSREWCGEGGVSTECLSAVVLWVSSGSPPPKRSTSSWAPLDPPLRRNAAPPRPANHGSLPHTASPAGGGGPPQQRPPPPNPAAVLSPALSSLTHRSL